MNFMSKIGSTILDAVITATAFVANFIAKAGAMLFMFVTVVVMLALVPFMFPAAFVWRTVRAAYETADGLLARLTSDA